MTDDLPAQFFPDVDGFCRPDWAQLDHHFEQRYAAHELDAAWTKVARRWLTRLSAQLHQRGHLAETGGCLALCDASPTIAREAATFCDQATQRLLHELPGIARDEGYGKRVVLLLTDPDDYYRYISHFLPAGEHPISGGLFISDCPYHHFVITLTRGHLYRSALAHELTHACLAHLPLPAWLNEAVAMRMEEMLTATPSVDLNRERIDECRRYWNGETIQLFWSGESWAINSEGFLHGYTLARILWDIIETQSGATREELLAFLGDASDADAGAAACRTHLGLELGDLLGSFLGTSDLGPDPSTWPNHRM